MCDPKLGSVPDRQSGMRGLLRSFFVPRTLPNHQSPCIFRTMHSGSLEEQPNSDTASGKPSGRRRSWRDRERIQSCWNLRAVLSHNRSGGHLSDVPAGREQGQREQARVCSPLVSAGAARCRRWLSWRASGVQLAGGSASGGNMVAAWTTARWPGFGTLAAISQPRTTGEGLLQRHGGSATAETWHLSSTFLLSLKSRPKTTAWFGCCPVGQALRTRPAGHRPNRGLRIFMPGPDPGTPPFRTPSEVEYGAEEDARSKEEALRKPLSQRFAGVLAESSCRPSRRRWPD